MCTTEVSHQYLFLFHVAYELLIIHHKHDVVNITLRLHTAAFHSKRKWKVRS